MKQLSHALLGVGMLCVPMLGVTATVQNCQSISWQPNKIYSISAELNKATHIILPEPMRGKPVVGNRDLWDVDGQGMHLFVKPNNMDSKDGASTTVTIIGQSDASYDFELRRVASSADLCVRIEQQGAVLGAASPDEWKTQQERLNDLLQERVGDLQDQVTETRKTSEQQAMQAVQEYRSNIYTGYEWNRGKGFIGEDLVEDVWDDGRFTYVRVKTDNKGLLQISAELDGQEELIEYQYDSDKKLYTIAGLYPELILRYARTKVRVVREDNNTSGGY